MTAELKSTSEGRTMVLTLSNPSQRNALGPEMYAAGIEALSGAENSDEIRSVVITGEGAWFCAGGYLQRLSANRERDRLGAGPEHRGAAQLDRFDPHLPQAGDRGRRGRRGRRRLLARRWPATSSSLPTMRCSRPRTATSRCRPTAASAGTCASAAAPAGKRMAACSASASSAERLHALGMVNEIAESGQALSTALALANRLNARAPNALASIKELLSEARGATLASQLAQRARSLRAQPAPRQRRHRHRRLPGQADAALRVAAGRSRDNSRPFSHAQDSPWTTPFLPSKNVKRSTVVAGSPPSLHRFVTTSSDALSSNATRTAS